MVKKKHSSQLFIMISLIMLFLFSATFLPNTGLTRSGDIWCMTHDYFNFAKSMLSGKVLYTDLYDHKGLLLFLLYLIPVHISDTSLIGVFLMEAFISIGIALSCYLYCIEKYSHVASVIYTGITLVLFRLAYSELMLNTEPICIIILFSMLRYTEECAYRRFRRCDYFIFGLLFGILFWMKYPTVLILFPFWCYFLYYSIKEKKLWLFMKRNILSGYGFLLVSIPVAGYSVYNENLKLLWKMYFCSIKFVPFGFRGTMPEMIAVIIGILTGFGISIVWKTDKKDVFFGISILCVFLLLNIPGGVRAYTSCFLIVLIPMFLPHLLKHRYMRAVGVGCMAMIIGISLLGQSKGKENGLSAEEIAKKYRTTNQNVWYLYEDMGLGTASSEPYRYRFQWKPGRVSYEDNNSLYLDTMDVLKNKKIQYVCVNADDFNRAPDGNVDRYARIIHTLKDNYEVMDTFVFDEGVSISYYFMEMRTDTAGSSSETPTE